jgi:hypothetical protein
MNAGVPRRESDQDRCMRLPRWLRRWQCRWLRKRRSWLRPIARFSNERIDARSIISSPRTPERTHDDGLHDGQGLRYVQSR